MNFKDERILFISAHTDDAEHSCGGTMVKFSGTNDMFHATFSFAEESLPEDFDRNSTRRELMESMRILGIPHDNVLSFGYHVRRFPEYRQNILDNIIEIRNAMKPTIVFTHSLNDYHQDHKTIAEESFRAFKDNATLISYNNIRNAVVNRFNLFVELDLEQLKHKIEAMMAYKSQAVKGRYDREFISGQAVTYGRKINTQYAEAFEIVRMKI